MRICRYDLFDAEGRILIRVEGYAATDHDSEEVVLDCMPTARLLASMCHGVMTFGPADDAALPSIAEHESEFATVSFLRSRLRVDRNFIEESRLGRPPKKAEN